MISSSLEREKKRKEPKKIEKREKIEKMAVYMGKIHAGVRLRSTIQF